MTATDLRLGVPGLRLGAPGVYRSPQVVEPAYQPVRLDVAGFVGVALRGPVNECTLVSTWSDYERIFGEYERPGGGPDRMLPYAVAAFFAQGGVRAYVVRVVSSDRSGVDAATAHYQLGDIQLCAANEGSWGGALTIELGYVTAQTFPVVVRVTGDTSAEVAVPRGLRLAVGSLLRVRGPGLLDVGEFRWVLAMDTDRAGNPVATLDAGVGNPAASVTAAIVTASVDVVDGDPGFARHETVSGLGLHPAHPRYLGAVLDKESELVRILAVPAGPLTPSRPLLLPVRASLTHPGSDRWDTITGASFFDDDLVDADPLDELPHRGVDLIGRQSEIGILCAPDLLWQWPRAVSPPAPDRPQPSPCFVRCDAEPTASVPYAASPISAARLDARDPGQLDEMVLRQQRMVAVAVLRRRFVALLDVPSGLALNDVTRWRAWFDTSYAAAYHPWLQLPRIEAQPGAAGLTDLLVPPSIFGAGIIAARERRLGLSRGPANELATGVVGAAEQVTDAQHDRLHALGVNVFRAERDGFRLTAARTLSSDPDYRQLSVRRLMTMLALTLDRQSQWLVFEPNTADLRSQLTHTVVQFLRGLFRAGAFAGATEAQSFFVHCDDGLNPRQSQEQGRLIAQIGVAPASPLEYLVLRISQDTDGRVHVEAQGG